MKGINIAKAISDRWLIPIACLLFFTSSVFGTGYYVKTDGSDDANGLSEAAAFKTIQKAIDTAGNSDEVTVETGVYYESIDFKGKAVTVQSKDPESWYTVESTIIDSNDAEYAVVFNSSEDANSIFTGLTVRNGYYGIYCVNSSTPVIKRCVIEQNVRAACCGSSPFLINNKIRNNIEGIVCINNAQPVIKSNMIYDSFYGLLCWGTTGQPGIYSNTFVNNSIYGIGVYTEDANRPTIRNCILWGNGDSLYSCNATYSCIENANDANGTGNITDNPAFVDVNNYHISPGSPCIDAGNPNEQYDANQKDIDNEARFIDGDEDANVITDIGSDEYDFRKEDINADGIINFIDYVIFANAWQSDSNDGNWDPNCDFNTDGVVNTSDLGIFSEQWLWEAGWRAPMNMGGEYMMMMGGGDGLSESMNSSVELSSDVLSARSVSTVLSTESVSISPVQTEIEPVAASVQEEVAPVSTAEMLKWLIDLWKEDESIRNSMTEEEFIEFLKSVQSSQ